MDICTRNLTLGNLFKGINSRERKKICTEMFHHYFNSKEMENQGTPRNLDGGGMNG